MKFRDPFVGLTGFPQLIIEQVAVSQDPLARHATEVTERVYPGLQVTDAEDPKIVVVKSKDPLDGLTGVPQLTGEQVAASHVPLARHAIEEAERVYPESQVTDADEP